MAEPAEETAHPRIFTVGELMGGLRGLLEARVGRIYVVGEISNLHNARSGHVYFTLKDDEGQIRAAMFRNAARRVAFEPEDGLEVVVHGDVTVYESRGDLQIIVRDLEPRGQGALQLAFEQLRRKLEAEGLFDPATKRELPELPGAIGLVTSPGGAVIHDFLQVTGRRFPAVPILIAPSRVQGEGAEGELAAAIEALGAREEISVIVVARGGGSLEDLMAFNSEIVARAVARSPVPVVSGVGHEVDVTICDLAADVRAPTPSAAAELVLPDRSAHRATLQRDWQRLERAIRVVMERGTTTLQRESEALRALAPSARLATQRARFRALARALAVASTARVERTQARLAGLAGRLDSLSPLAVLDRGYALVRRRDDSGIVRSGDDVIPGDRLAIRVAAAEIDAVVEAVRVPDP